jgi:hypothetical protein
VLDQFGPNLTPAPPGSAHGLLLSVADVEAARQDLAGRGAVNHCTHTLAEVCPRLEPIPWEQVKAELDL